MLKIFFPAGVEIPAIPDFKNIENKFNILSLAKVSDDEKISILLLSRIFSLVPL